MKKGFFLALLVIFSFGILRSQVELPDLSRLKNPKIDLSELKDEIKRDHSELLNESDIWKRVIEARQAGKLQTSLK